MNNYKKIISLHSENWLSVKNQNSDIAEIRIDGVIGGCWDADDKTAADFIRELNGVSASQINLHINSPGGDVSHGLAMYNALSAIKKSKKVCGFVDGLAASIASVVLMAADEIIMPENAFLMVHEPWTIAIGNARQFKAVVEDLEKFGDSIVKIYADRSGMDDKDIRDLMRGKDGADGTFITASECLELGLCTEVRENVKAAACIGIELFDQIPDGLRKIGTALNKRALEDSLREAGYSLAQSKIIASGKAFSRDVENAGHINWENLLKQLKGN